MEDALSTPKTRRESEVWQACDDLWAQNSSARTLTGDNIRDQLLKLGYKRGSPNEIYRYRTSWRESRGITDIGEQSDTDVKSSDPISRAVSMVYDQMRTQATDEIEKLTEEFEAQRKAALLEEQALKERCAALELEKADLQTDLSSAQKRVAELDIAFNNQQKELVVFSERLKGAREQVDTLRAEHERLVLELKTFHEREIDLWRTQNNEAQKMLAEHKRQAKADTERQGAEFSEELMKLKTELRQAYEEKVAALAKVAALSPMSEMAHAQDKHHLETLSWLRKVERYLQRKPARAPLQPSRGRRC